MIMAASIIIPQIHVYTNNTRGNHLQFRRKSNKNLHFLLISTSTTLSTSLPYTSTFPVSIKSSSNPVQFHPISNSVHDNLIEELENSMNSYAPANGVRQTEAAKSCRRIYIRDSPRISSLISNGLHKSTSLELKLEFKENERRKYNMLRRRQIKVEAEAWERMVEEYRELEREMRKKNLAPNLPHIKALFLGWFGPLVEAIEREQKSKRSKKHKAAFAPNIDLLPADKMTVIVMYKMMCLVMQEEEVGCVELVRAAV